MADVGAVLSRGGAREPEDEATLTFVVGHELSSGEAPDAFRTVDEAA